MLNIPVRSEFIFQQTNSADSVLPTRRDIRISTFFNVKFMVTYAHVLLNLCVELGILSLFRNEFNKFNKTRSLMLDTIYHMALGIL